MMDDENTSVSVTLGAIDDSETGDISEELLSIIDVVANSLEKMLETITLDVDVGKGVDELALDTTQSSVWMSL